MIAGLAIKGLSGGHGINGYWIPIELPHDYQLSPETWRDLQRATIALLKFHEEKNEMAPCFNGMYGDGNFSWMVNQYSKQHGKIT